MSYRRVIVQDTGIKVPLVKYPFLPLNSLQWIPSRLVRDLRATLCHAQKVYFSTWGEIQTAFVNDQNVYLDTKVNNVGSNISTFEHCTNFPHMERLEHTLVKHPQWSVSYLSRTIPSR